VFLVFPPFFSTYNHYTANMSTFQSYHNVRDEETLHSIAARYRQNPGELMLRNSLGHESEVHTRSKIVVTKDKRHACSRTCIHITGKYWQRCDCNYVKKSKPVQKSRNNDRGYARFRNGYAISHHTMYTNNTDDDIPLVDMASLRHRPSTPNGYLISEDEKFARALFNKLNSDNVALFSSEERSKFPQPTLGTTPSSNYGFNNNQTNCAVAFNAGLNAFPRGGSTPEPLSNDERMAWALHQTLNNDQAVPLFGVEETAKFPIPTLGSEGYKLFSEEERTKFPIPTLQAQANYKLFNEDETYKFPTPTLQQQQPANYKLFNEDETYKFPTPTLQQQQPANYKLFNQTERAMFPIPICHQTPLISLN